MRVFQRTVSKMEIWDWFTYCPAGKEDIILNDRWGNLAQGGSSVVQDFSGDDPRKCPRGGETNLQQFSQHGIH